VSKEPSANHPAIGPGDRVAYVAGRDAQRVYVDGKAISPPGFLASAPTFCDTEKGLVVVFTVGFGAWADVIAIDLNGGGIRRLTQGMGANSSASCSPDGRLVAFFSDRGMPGKGPGLYMLPIARPWLAKKISGEVGEGLRWDAIAK
jgi:TolB protein